MDGRWAIWPERRFIQDDDIINYAEDHAEDAKDPINFDSVDDAVAYLQDTGEFTFAPEGVVPPETSESREPDIQAD